MKTLKKHKKHKKECSRKIDLTGEVRETENFIVEQRKFRENATKENTEVRL